MRWLLIGVSMAAAGGPAAAHVLYLVPDGGAGFAVVFNDTPAPDPQAGLGAFERATFTRVGASGAKSHGAAVPGKPGVLALDGDAVAAYGSVPYGVVQRGDPHPVLVAFHPKAVAVPVRPDSGFAPAGLPLELTPVATPAGLAFLVTENGRPVGGQEVLVTAPGEAKPTAVTTGPDGRTPAFGASGGYAARAYRGSTLPADQEFQGRRHRGVRDYATLTARYDGGR